MNVSQQINRAPALAAGGVVPNARASVHRFTDAMRGVSMARKSPIARREQR